MSEASGVPYQIKKKDGTILEGVLDTYGRTERLFSDKPEEAVVLVGDGEWEIVEGIEYD